MLNGAGPCPKNIQRLDSNCRPMVHAMMTRGLQIDPAHFAKMDELLTQDMEQMTEEVKQVAGHYINLGSGDQVSHFLFKELGIKQARPKMTKSGDRESVDGEVLTAVQHLHPVISKILNYKEYDKLRGTYARPIPKLARKVDGKWRLMPWLKDTRIPSGRFSCDAPNLLAMPNRTDRGRELLNGFVTDPGWVFLSVDFSQIEPRVVAHRSGDARLRGVYINKEDIYSDFSYRAFKLEDKRFKDDTGKWQYPGVNKKAHRTPSKICILASIYRVTAKGLVEQMPVLCANCGAEASDHTASCSRFSPIWNENNCQGLIDDFYRAYPGVGEMQRMDDGRARARTMVWDGFGRLLHTAAVRSVHPWVVSAAEREAGNMPIQGFACGCLKLSMAQIFDELTSEKLMGTLYHPLLPIHDEVLGEVRQDLAEQVGEYISYVFSNCVKLEVPITAEWACAPTWGKIVK